MKDKKENAGTPAFRTAPDAPDAPLDVMDAPLDVMDAYAAAAARTDGSAGLRGPVDRDVILEAAATLQRYRAGKAHLESRIVDNEEYYRLTHNGLERGRAPGYSKGRYRRNTAWLFTAIANKVADFQDNYPEASVLPREPGDEEAARQLTAILPAILEKNGYRELYRHTSLDKVKHGAGVQMVVWDSERENGLGDVAIRRVDPLNIFWEPGITDIQDSADVFTVELRRNDEIAAQYPAVPDLSAHLGSPAMNVTRYVYNDSIDNSDKSYVVNWYYKKRIGGRTVLHYCRFVNDALLYASENDPRYAAEGWYRHGLYPFVFFTMYPEAGTPFGFGEIDIGRDAQDDIDELNAEILRNVKQAARRRFLCRNGGGINEREYMDLDRDIVHAEGPLDEVALREVTVSPLSPAVLQVYAHKIDELKETTANRDVTQGGAGGTSTASGIAALQESGNKVSRDLIASSYESFKRVCGLIIELVRQFYDVPRAVRVTGGDGAYTFMEMSNAALQSRTAPGAFGVAAYRTAEPTFDVSVKAYKQNPYSKRQANQDAINLYGMGFFTPRNAPAALACLELLEMEDRDKVRRAILQNFRQWAQAQTPGETDAPRAQGRALTRETSLVDRARRNAQEGTEPR